MRASSLSRTGWLPGTGPPVDVAAGRRVVPAAAGPGSPRRVGPVDASERADLDAEPDLVRRRGGHGQPRRLGAAHDRRARDPLADVPRRPAVRAVPVVDDDRHEGPVRGVRHVGAEVAAVAADRPREPPLDDRRTVDGVDEEVRRQDAAAGLGDGEVADPGLHALGQVREREQVDALDAPRPALDVVLDTGQVAVEHAGLDASAADAGPVARRVVAVGVLDGDAEAGLEAAGDDEVEVGRERDTLGGGGRGGEQGGEGGGREGGGQMGHGSQMQRGPGRARRPGPPGSRGRGV